MIILVFLTSSCSKNDQSYIRINGLPKDAKVLFFEVLDKDKNKVKILNWYAPFNGSFSVIRPWGHEGKFEIDSENYSVQYDKKKLLGVFYFSNETWQYSIVQYQKKNMILTVDLDVSKMKALGKMATEEINRENQQFNLE